MLFRSFQISIFNQKILIQNFIEKNPKQKIKRKGGMLIAQEQKSNTYDSYFIMYSTIFYRRTKLCETRIRSK